MDLRSMNYADCWQAVPKTRRNLGLIAVFLFGIANFIAFYVVSTWLGGDALNGKIQGGHLFLSDHGRLREVSEAVFTYSRWHASSLFVTHPLAIFCAFLMARDMRRAT